MAFEINDGYAPAYYWYSYYLSFVEGKFEESIKLAQRAAVQLEPFVSISHHVLAVVNVNAGNYDQALISSKMAIELDPKTFFGYRTLGISLMCLKRYDEAIEAYKKSALFSARHPWILIELSCNYTMVSQVSEAQKIMDELIQRSQSGFIPGLYVVAYHLKYYDEAIAYLEDAIIHRDGSLISTKYWPFTQFVKSDPRFQPYLKRLNFPD